MNFELSLEDQAFRAEVREFIRMRLPADIAARTRTGAHHSSREDVLRWTAILHERGWSVPLWPVADGGTGWSGMQQHIFDDERWIGGAPLFNYQGVQSVGPLICAFGSAAQKAQHLPGIREGRTFWCQGFSEPGAGSDLVSLKTTAILQGDHYVVNGQKVWTSNAHESDWGFFLVRTDPEMKAHGGLSLLLMDMKSPGLTIRPIIGIDGAHHLNEVFLDNVIVPPENMIGEPGKGWTYAKYLLGHERTGTAFVNWTRYKLTVVRDIASKEMRGGRPLAESETFRRKAARMDADIAALEWSVLRILSDEPNPRDGNALTSALKLRGSLLQQRVMDMACDVLGDRSLRYYDAAQDREQLGLNEVWGDNVPGHMGAALFFRAATIAGGSDEVLKNIIAKVGLGL